MGLQAAVHPVARGVRAGWLLTVYPQAAEAGGSFRTLRPWSGERGVSGCAADPERAASEAARRARATVRRYCAANRLNRLGTLTYRGGGCHDPQALREDVARFFRRLREVSGGQPFPYLWVPEWHKTDHGLHVHFAVGRYLRRSLIAQAWGHGFVHIKLLGDLPVGSTAIDQARQAARYLSKYVSKAVDERRIPGLHRYERAQGFDPTRLWLEGNTKDAVLAQACEMFGAKPQRSWCSDDAENWRGPPAAWFAWN